MDARKNRTVRTDSFQPTWLPFWRGGISFFLLLLLLLLLFLLLLLLFQRFYFSSPLFEARSNLNVCLFVCLFFLCRSSKNLLVSFFLNWEWFVVWNLLLLSIFFTIDELELNGTTLIGFIFLGYRNFAGFHGLDSIFVEKFAIISLKSFFYRVAILIKVPFQLNQLPCNFF